MADSDLLSQDEVDALLYGVDSGDVDVEPEPEPQGVRPIDVANHERIVRGRMPTLEMINDRFARQFRISLFNLLRRTSLVATRGIETRKFSEYVHSLHVPSSLHLVRVHPFSGIAMVVVDPRLVFRLVDTYFGGDGRHQSKVEGRDFSDTEMRVVHLLLEKLFEDWVHAWEPVVEIRIDYQSAEMNPQFANICSPTEVVVVSVFEVELEGGTGYLHITMPYSMIEPVRGQLDAGIQSDRSDINDRWAHALRREIDLARLELRGVLLERELSLRDVLEFDVGDVVPIDLPEASELRVEGVPVMRGRFGISNGFNALRVETMLNQKPAMREGKRQ
jgi:flagellar motor switch protein FliM